MRLYETSFLIAPTLPEEEAEKLIEKMAGIVSEKKGKMINVDKWGKRRLAYPIKKFEDAVYVFFLYKGDVDIPTELERNFKQTESVIRYLTIKMEERDNIRRTKKGASRTVETLRKEPYQDKKVGKERVAEKKVIEPASEEKPKEEVAVEEKKKEKEEEKKEDKNVEKKEDKKEEKQEAQKDEKDEEVKVRAKKKDTKTSAETQKRKRKDVEKKETSSGKKEKTVKEEKEK